MEEELQSRQNHIENIQYNIENDRVYLDEHIVDIALNEQHRDIELLEREIDTLLYEKDLLRDLMNLGSLFVLETLGSIDFCHKRSHNLHATIEFIYCVQISHSLIRCLYEANIVNECLYRLISSSLKPYKEKSVKYLKTCEEIFSGFCKKGLRDIYKDILPTYTS